MSLTVLKKRLLYISAHRGTKEADIILGQFAQKNLPHMTAEDLACFETILSHTDAVLMQWISDPETIPTNDRTPIMARLCAFLPAGYPESLCLTV